jgi:luciferase family oxidoreductase group 1
VTATVTATGDDLKLSVLDLAPVGEGSTVGAALRASIELAAEAERLGYHRYWVAEHHNMPGIASSSPAVLLAHAASATETIRVGSGGVMLPNHAPLVVAEQFGMLEALHPGRVDLGLGRAPGTDPRTARALRGSTQAVMRDDFPEQLAELRSYFSGESSITAVPGQGQNPAIWLLGSSDYSAVAAGLLGLPFSFAHHFAAHNTLAAVAAYRNAFRPSEQLERPYLMLGVAVVCADTEQHARWLAGSSRLAFVRLRTGRPGRLPTPEEADAYTFTPQERELIKTWQFSVVVGTPDTVRQQLDDLAQRTEADELIITTMVHDPAERLRSYRLVADAYRAPPRAASTNPTNATSVTVGPGSSSS